jgi:adenylosuccinate synthase
MSKERRIAVVRAIVGANWGDEGKGKITDMFAGQADIVVRFQGGANAGHTIINDYGKFALHLLPSGVCQPNTVNIIGNGVALDIPKLDKEIKALVAAGVPNPKIMVSERTQIMMPYHVLLDTYEEERLQDRQFGSTKSGIAPFYSDKYAKIGFQVCELFDDDYLRQKLQSVCEIKNLMLEHIYKKPVIDVDELFNTLLGYRETIAPYVCDTGAFLRQAVKDGKNILLEGQLGSLKDPDFGIYPMVTSSSTLAGFAAVGAGIAPNEIKDIIAVTKAYSSAVGAGEFVSEIFGEEAQIMRTNGGDAGEYGATTGRPRRMGWFDCVATRYGCQVQGATQVVLTAIDCLSYLDEIKICIGYEIDGNITKDFPVTPALKNAKPVLISMPGFKCDIRGIRDFEKLPVEAREYVLFIEKEIGFPITMVSNGPRREEIIFRK